MSMEIYKYKILTELFTDNFLKIKAIINIHPKFCIMMYLQFGTSEPGSLKIVFPFTYLIVLK